MTPREVFKVMGHLTPSECRKRMAAIEDEMLKSASAASTGAGLLSSARYLEVHSVPVYQDVVRGPDGRVLGRLHAVMPAAEKRVSQSVSGRKILHINVGRI